MPLRLTSSALLRMFTGQSPGLSTHTMKPKIQVQKCPFVHPPNEGQENPVRIYNPDAYNNLEELKDDLFSDFGYDFEARKATLHSAGSCADQVKLEHLHEGGFIRQRTENYPVPELEVCFIVKTPLRPPIPMRPEIVQRLSSDADIDCYVRVGRRPLEDQDDDIKTEFVVVAHIEVREGKSLFQWLSVPTWHLNGLRIGDCESGDIIRGRLDSPERLQKDPYFSAWDVGSAPSVKEYLLRLAKAGNIKTMEETPDENEADKERSDASAAARALYTRRTHEWSNEDRLVIIWGEAARINPYETWPHPWQLPTRPERKRESFPGKPPDMRATTPPDVEKVHVILTFTNDLCDQGLGLKSYVQPVLEGNCTLKHFQAYLRRGDEDLEGLDKNWILEGRPWDTEIWVLPQAPGCKYMYSWNQDDILVASDFCDPDALIKDGRAMLYMEVRIHSG